MPIETYESSFLNFIDTRIIYPIGKKIIFGNLNCMLFIIESNFIKVLAKSYETVAKELNKFIESEIKDSNKSQQLSLFPELSQEENNNLTEEEKATILWQRKNC